MSEATDFLKEAVEKSIKRIDQEQSLHGVCPAHGGIADGVHTLLLCKRTELDRAGKFTAGAVVTIGLFSGVISAVVAIIALCVGK